MADVPRRLPPTPEERLTVVVDRMLAGSNAGSTRFARPVPTSVAAMTRIVASSQQPMPVGANPVDPNVGSCNDIPTPGVIGQQARQQFTVSSSVTITAVSYAKSNDSVFTGAHVGIASNFAGTSVVPWLGKSESIVPTTETGWNWHTYTLDTPVSLVAGVTYAFVSDGDGFVGYMPTTSNFTGIIATVGDLKYGSTYDGVVGGAMSFRLLGHL